MNTPYEILGVTANADDTDIKQAYLQKVKDNPPDRDPAQFQVLHDAYSAVKDRKSRISYELFTMPSADFDALLKQSFPDRQSVPINAEQFTQLLQASIDDHTLLNAINSDQP
ncbi:MAG: DnaJ domain-containing protein [Methylococcales bacterium]